jgi:hypothetical protein
VKETKKRRKKKEKKQENIACKTTMHKNAQKPTKSQKNPITVLVDSSM